MEYTRDNQDSSEKEAKNTSGMNSKRNSVEIKKASQSSQGEKDSLGIGFQSESTSTDSFYMVPQIKSHTTKPRRHKYTPSIMDGRIFTSPVLGPQKDATNENSIVSLIAQSLDNNNITKGEKRASKSVEKAYNELSSFEKALTHLQAVTGYEWKEHFDLTSPADMLLKKKGMLGNDNYIYLPISASIKAGSILSATSNKEYMLESFKKYFSLPFGNVTNSNTLRGFAYPLLDIQVIEEPCIQESNTLSPQYILAVSKDTKNIEIIANAFNSREIWDKPEARGKMESAGKWMDQLENNKPQTRPERSQSFTAGWKGSLSKSFSFSGGKK